MILAKIINKSLRPFNIKLTRLNSPSTSIDSVQNSSSGPSAFDHGKAQVYEFASGEGTIKDHFLRVYADWEKAKSEGILWTSAREWFPEDNAYNDFVDFVKSRKCIEVGAGPFGFLPLCDWIKDRTVIEPLADDYRRVQLENYGKTFYTDDLKRYPIAAETFIPELKGKVDGAIITRNAIDHADDPLAILANLADYAARGCYLLFWGEIWHLDGCDEGHRNITKSVKSFESLIKGLGFEIIPQSSFQRNDPSALDYGFIARKL